MPLCRHRVWNNTSLAGFIIRDRIVVIPRRQIELVFLILLLTAVLFTREIGGQSLEPGDDVPASCLSVPSLVASAVGFEHVVNPVLVSRNEIEDTVEEFKRLQNCLDQVAGFSDRTLTARSYVELFVSFLEPFVGSESNELLELVDLATTLDPGIRRLREEVGLQAPDGIIFVRYFRQVEQMPAVVRRAFDNPQAQAVTIGTRYIAALTPVPRSIVQREMLDDALETTISHELIHAFLNAHLGSDIFEKSFPSWFQEGMAIHFSGSGRGHVAIDNSVGNIFAIEPTVEYEQYERAFRYLDFILGTDNFHAAVREAVSEADTSKLLIRAGFDSYSELQGQAELWWRWWPIPVGLLVVPQVWVLFALGGLGVFAFWHLSRRWQPAVPGSALEVGVNENLFEAVKSADDEGVMYLLRSGAEPNSVDGEGWSVLRWAVFFNRAAAVEALMAAGAESSRELLVFAESRDTTPDIIRLLADSLDSLEGSAI